MRIVELSQDKCKELLNRASLGRLACSLENQPYVVPVCFACEPEHLYVTSLSTLRASMPTPMFSIHPSSQCRVVLFDNKKPPTPSNRGRLRSKRFCVLRTGQR